MRKRRPPSTALVLGLLLIAIAAGAARAAGDQTTDPDACAVLGKARVAALLGPGIVSHRQRFELPDLPAGERDLDKFLDVSRTGCTWFDPAKAARGALEAVDVQVYEQNTGYSGPHRPPTARRPAAPWTPIEQVVVFTRLAGGSRSGAGGYALLVTAEASKELRAPWLDGDDVYLVVDRATRGRRKAIVGVTLTDTVWVAVTVTGGRNALAGLAAVTRHLLGG